MLKRLFFAFLMVLVVEYARGQQANFPGITSGTPGQPTVYTGSNSVGSSPISLDAYLLSKTDPSVGIAAAEAALPSGSGIVDARGYGCTAYNTSQEIDVGDGGSKHVVLLVPPCGAWTALMTGGTAYGLKVLSGSAALGMGAGEGAPFVIQAGASSNLDTVCGSDPGSFGYVRMEGFSCSTVAGATVANAVLNIQKLYDTSYVGLMHADTHSTAANKVLWIHTICCSAKVTGINADAYGVANAIPCTIGAAGTTEAAGDIEGLSCVHAGSGKNQLALVQTPALNGNKIRNIYMETSAGSSDLTTASIGVTGTVGAADILDGVVLGIDVASSTRYLLDLASGTSIEADKLTMGPVSTASINDHNTGTACNPGCTAAAYSLIRNYGTSPAYFGRVIVNGSTWTSTAGVPSANCAIGDIDTNKSASSTSTLFYVCYPANTWIATAVP
jgi:hypothetical protein